MRVNADREDKAVWRLRLSADDGRELVLTEIGLASLKERLEEAEADPDCRVIVLEGEEGTFCRGLDLEGVLANPWIHVATGLRSYADVLLLLRRSKKIVVALVDGTVLGGGVGLAAAADFLIATERSEFGLPEVVLGLVPSLVLPILLDRMPSQKARRIAMTGLRWNASEAERFGLVDWIIPSSDDLEGALWSKTRQFLRVAPESVSRLKDLADRLEGLPLEGALSFGRQWTAETLRRPETIAALRSFLDGGTPAWFARPRSREARG